MGHGVTVIPVIRIERTGEADGHGMTMVRRCADRLEPGERAENESQNDEAQQYIAQPPLFVSNSVFSQPHFALHRLRPVCL